MSAQRRDNAKIKLSVRPQFIATARLIDSGDVRAALQVLRSDRALSPHLRRALADWIEKGCKCKQGKFTRPSDPWELPNGLVISLGYPASLKQWRAWLLFVELARGFGPVRARGRGRPPSRETRPIAGVAKRLGVTPRTARAWFGQFMRNPDFARLFE